MCYEVVNRRQNRGSVSCASSSGCDYRTPILSYRSASYTPLQRVPRDATWIFTAGTDRRRRSASSASLNVLHYQLGSQRDPPPETEFPLYCAKRANGALRAISAFVQFDELVDLPGTPAFWPIRNPSFNAFSCMPLRGRPSSRASISTGTVSYSAFKRSISEAVHRRAGPSTPILPARAFTAFDVRPSSRATCWLACRW